MADGAHCIRSFGILARNRKLRVDPRSRLELSPVSHAHPRNVPRSSGLPKTLDRQPQQGTARNGGHASGCPGETIHNEPLVVTPELAVEAMLQPMPPELRFGNKPSPLLGRDNAASFGHTEAEPRCCLEAFCFR